jgi:magnesium transporter
MVRRSEIDLSELTEAWWVLSTEDRLEGFRMLDPADAEAFFNGLSASDQAELLLELAPAERRLWLRTLAPDDAADVIQAEDEERRQEFLALLDEATRREVAALLAYEEDEAGGLMSSRFARVRPDMTVDEAISYLRRQAVGAIEPDTIYYVYVLDAEQRLLGVISFRDLFSAPGSRLVRDVMNTDVVVAPDDMDQEALAHLFAEHDLLAIPVIDTRGVLRGIVTVDDIVDVVEEEATEDAHKSGAVEVLEEPYMRIGMLTLVRKRAGWLTVLFMAQLITTNVIRGYEGYLAEVTILAAFLPMIISSGGNSGSQASTLVIRAMAVGEVRLRDWWRVARRELAAGLTLGLLLATLGMLRVGAGHLLGESVAVNWQILGVIISLSLLSVVIFGTMLGSMLPFLLRSVGLDPASASAPLVATVSDVTGLLTYFTLATMMLRQFAGM